MSHITKKSGLKNTLFIPEEVFRNKPENDVREIVRKEAGFDKNIKDEIVKMKT